MVLIGLMGYAGCGKDETCKAIQDAVPAVRFAFADGLKCEVADALCISTEELERDKDLYYRELLQGWGVMRRKENEDYWVKLVDYKLHFCSAELSVITDVRFPNEVEFIRENCGILVRVERPGIGPVNGHISESAIEGVKPDYTILNSGSKEDLRRAVEGLLQTLPLG